MAGRQRKTVRGEGAATSYIAPPGSGPHSREEGESAFPYSTTSWYFLDEVDMNVAGKGQISVFGLTIPPKETK